MKQLISFLILFTLTLLLFTPNVAAAALSSETAEISYQINYSDRIVTGTVSRMVEYSNYTIITITVNEWLYNPLPAKTIKVRTETRTNFWTEDEAEFTQNESVLLMLKDKDLDKQLFSVATGFPGKHPASDRDAVIEELKTQGKWQSENKTENMANNARIKEGISENSSNNSIELNNNSNGNKSSTINSSPGFELLGSLTCLYSGWRLRKK